MTMASKNEPRKNWDVVSSGDGGATGEAMRSGPDDRLSAWNSGGDHIEKTAHAGAHQKGRASPKPKRKGGEEGDIVVHGAAP